MMVVVQNLFLSQDKEASDTVTKDDVPVVNKEVNGDENGNRALRVLSAVVIVRMDLFSHFFQYHFSCLFCRLMLLLSCCL